MKEVGRIFGTLTSTPLSFQAATDVRHALEKSVIGLLETAGGKLINAAKAVPVVAMAVEGGKAIIFDVAGDSSDVRAKERELRKSTREKVRQQEQLRAELQAEIEHLVYVAVLSDSPGVRVFTCGSRQLTSHDLLRRKWLTSASEG